jgi:hypothetical protein
MPPLRRAARALLLPAVVAATLGRAHAGTAWEHVLSEDGIEVQKRENPERGFPTFRGIGVLESNVFQVLAVLRDIDRHKEWMERSAESTLLEKKDERHYVVYGRTRAPWPASDRDAVFESEVTTNPARSIFLIRFWAVASRRKPEVDGVVRMRRLQGYFRIEALDAKRTRVTYEVDADPGGLLPRWMAKLATRTMPLKTIRRMRAQVTRTAGWYDDQIRRWKAEL